MIGIYINIIMGFNKSVFNLLATPQFLFKEDYTLLTTVFGYTTEFFCGKIYDTTCIIKPWFYRDDTYFMCKICQPMQF